MVLRSFDYFFIETHLCFQKNRNIDRFDNSSLILRFKTHCGKNITKFSEFQNFQLLFGRKSIGFFNKTQFLKAMSGLNQKDQLKHFLRKLSHVQPLWENLCLYSKKKPPTFTKKPKFWTFSFWVFLRKSNTWDAS